MTVIAHVTDSTLQHRFGGKEMRADQLLSRMAGHGIIVETYTMALPSGAAFANNSYHRISANDELYVGGKRKIKATILFSLNCFKLLFKKFDLIDTDQIPLLHLIPIWLVAKLRNKPLVVTWHEYWPKQQWNEHLGSLGFIGLYLQNLALGVGDCLVSVSNQTYLAILGSGVSSSRLTLIQAGLDHVQIISKTPKKGSPKKQINILFIGRIIEHKRIDLILHAAETVAEKGFDVRVDIIGDGPGRESLEKSPRNARLKLQIIFHGNLELGEKFDALLNAADLFVSASEREGFGLAVAEAVSAGLPVIVSNHAENKSKELISGVLGCETFDAGSAENLAEKILDSYKLQLESERIRASFFDRHPDLTWSKASDDLAEIYSRLLNAKI